MKKNQSFPTKPIGIVGKRFYIIAVGLKDL